MGKIFKKGDQVSFILYNGTSKIVAEKLYEDLKNHTGRYSNNTPVPLVDYRDLPDYLKSSDLSISITTTWMEISNDVYKIFLKGELI